MLEEKHEAIKFEEKKNRFSIFSTHNFTWIENPVCRRFGFLWWLWTLIKFKQFPQNARTEQKNAKEWMNKKWNDEGLWESFVRT